MSTLARTNPDVARKVVAHPYPNLEVAWKVVAHPYPNLAVGITLF